MGKITYQYSAKELSIGRVSVLFKRKTTSKGERSKVKMPAISFKLVSLSKMSTQLRNSQMFLVLMVTFSVVLLIQAFCYFNNKQIFFPILKWTVAWNGFLA